jgi:hypothetical protein
MEISNKRQKISHIIYWCGIQLYPFTSKIEEKSSHIQPAPCFGRSTAG